MTKLPMALVALCATLAFTACGSDDGAGGGGAGAGGGDPAKGASGEVKQGGEVTTSQRSQPDFLDPAQAYTVNAWEVLWLVYTPPVTYKHAGGEAGNELVPGVAEELPEISEDRKTYTFKIREGLKYSDGSPVKASDWEHTIMRVLNLESGGSAFYLGIVGAEDYVKAGKPEGDIEGIETNDETREVKITLTEPDGTFLNVLALDFSGIVPGDTPFKNMTTEPPPGVGAYKITQSVPNRQFVLEKNANFDIPDIPKGNLDKITTNIVKNPQRETQDVISGKSDYLQDPPPSDLIGEVREKYSDRYKEFAVANIRYLWMNVKEAPFDKKEVRQAVNAAIDKRALARFYGGLSQPTCNFLPPGMPGRAQIDPCPYGDPNAAPDLEKAKQAIEQAGVKGMEVTVWGNDDDPTPKVTEYYADLLNQIGFKATPKILDAGVYFETIGNQSTKDLQTGYAGWLQDFPHPSNFFFLVDGKTIQPKSNQNFSNVDDPEITKGIAELKAAPKLEEVEDRWAELETRLINEAYIAPYGDAKEVTFMSERMNFADCSLVHPVYKNDYSSWCLK